MAIRTMPDLMISFLQDIYYAERQAVRAYPKLVKAADNADLKEALTRHREETQAQIQRLEQVFEHMGKRPRGKTCQAMNGLLEEADEALGEMERGPILDAALIACAQAMEHYEIARYGTMIAWARGAGEDDIVDLLEQTLEEEKRTDELLNEVAEEHINQQAADQDGEDEEEESEGGEEEEEAVEEQPRRAPARRTSTASRRR